MTVSVVVGPLEFVWVRVFCVCVGRWGGRKCLCWGYKPKQSRLYRERPTPKALFSVFRQTPPPPPLLSDESTLCHNGPAARR